MKSTGIVRKIDQLGRIVLPVELRRVMGIDTKDPIEIYMEGNHIIISKYEPACIFCGSLSEVSEYKGTKVCSECLSKLNK